MCESTGTDSHAVHTVLLKINVSSFWRAQVSGNVMYGYVNPPEEEETSLEAALSYDSSHNLNDVVMVSTSTYRLLFGDINASPSGFRTVTICAEPDVEGISSPHFFTCEFHQLGACVGGCRCSRVGCGV